VFVWTLSCVKCYYHFGKNSVIIFEHLVSAKAKLVLSRKPNSTLRKKPHNHSSIFTRESYAKRILAIVAAFVCCSYVSMSVTLCDYIKTMQARITFYSRLSQKRSYFVTTFCAAARCDFPRTRASKRYFLRSYLTAIGSSMWKRLQRSTKLLLILCRYKHSWRVFMQYQHR